MTRPLAPLPLTANSAGSYAGPSAAPSDAPLGPGLHPVVVQRALPPSPLPRSGLSSSRPAGGSGGFQVVTLAGQSLEAKLGDGVARALAEQCLRTGRFMLAAQSPRGVLLLGALQTELGPETQPDGTLVIAAKRIELRAEEELRARGGTSALKLQAEGKVRLNGHRLTIDMDTNVRVLSALVELP